MAAVRVNVSQLNGFAKPVRAHTVGIMPAGAAKAEYIAPPAVAAKKLTHDLIVIVYLASKASINKIKEKGKIELLGQIKG